MAANISLFPETTKFMADFLQFWTINKPTHRCGVCMKKGAFPPSPTAIPVHLRGTIRAMGVFFMQKHIFSAKITFFYTWFLTIKKRMCIFAASICTVFLS